MWRVILQLGFYDRSWMVVPIRVPLLLRYLPKEDAVHRMHRQGENGPITGTTSALRMALEAKL